MSKISTYKILSAAIFFGCFFLASCENDEKELSKLGQRKFGIEEAKNIKINFTTGGNAKAVLTSPIMLRVQDTVPYTEFPKTIFVDFYNDQQVIESKLTANYAKYKENQNLVFLRDSVNCNLKTASFFLFFIWKNCVKQNG